MITRKNLSLSLAVIAAPTVFITVPASAFGADTGIDGAALQEVVVTATKRATDEQTTPQAITAFSAADLTVRHVSDIGDLAMYTPGLFVGADNGFGATTMAIRGFGPLNLLIGGDEAVGVYIDGVYQGTPYGNQFMFIDVNQTEVLRGPQGTLYGRNATGGAILINTLTPGRNTLVRADIGAGELNSYEGSALVSGPLTNTLSGKIAIGRTSRDGWASNPILGTKLNGEDDFNTSASLHWTPGSAWDVSLGVRYGTESDTLAGKNVNDGLPIEEIPGNFPNEGSRSFSGVTLNATATMPWATFTSTTGWTNVDRHALTSSANVGLTQYLEESKAGEWYEEERLASNGDGRLSWMVGVNGFQQHADDVVDFDLTGRFLAAPSGLGIVFDNALRTTSYAGFVELGWKLTDRLHVTVGDRYTRDRKVWSNCQTMGQYSDIEAASVTPIGCNVPFNSETRAWSASTPKAVLDLRITDVTYAYASVNRGFRSGGWNFTSPVNPAEPYSTAFNPEYATSYEVGLKSEFFQRRMRANLAAYVANYTNLQVRTIDPVYHLLGVENAGAARTKGVELETVAKPTAALTMGANFAWERAIYTSFSYVSAGVPVNYAGNFLDDAPELMVNFFCSYDIKLPGGSTLTPRLDASYQSHVYYTEQNVSPYDSPAHEAVNVHLRYEAASAPWGWEIYVNNATNNQWRAYAYQGELNVVGVDYALPRLAGVRLFWNE